MNTQLLIHGLVQQTMVLLARVSTAGGVRAPLARVANQVFLDLTQELAAQGLAKPVYKSGRGREAVYRIADAGDFREQDGAAAAPVPRSTWRGSSCTARAPLPYARSPRP